MFDVSSSNYLNLITVCKEPANVTIADHMAGFDDTLYCFVLHRAVDVAHTNNCNTISTGYLLDDKIKQQFLDIKFYYDQILVGGHGWETMQQYRTHPELNYKNFICSFNGSAHVSRKLLVSILEKFGYYRPEYCSKNMTYSTNVLDGHISDYVPDQISLYRKFFISNSSENFFQTNNSFGHVRFEHDKNIYNLEHKLTQSFLHIVSETMATSYVPFVTEKFLYSIVTRGLFLSYAQPGWHDHIEKYYGFKRYTKLFDYRFDAIQNPVERLVELMTMISKFSHLTPHEWHDLYLLEQDNIEFNYDHYFSKNYLNELKKYED